MISGVLRQKITAKQPVFGVISAFTDPVACEYIGLSGFDFYIMDGEHGPVTAAHAPNLVRACENAGITAMARMRTLDEKLILQFLDAGVMGVIMPGIRSVADARQLISSVKYPPLGHRGLGPVRAADYMMGSMTQLEYITFANENTLIFLQIDDIAALDALPEILQLPEIDGCIIGHRDLAMSMGYLDSPNHVEVRKVVKDIGRQVLDAGKVLGSVAATASQAQDLLEQGTTLILTSALGLILQSSKALLVARSAFGSSRKE